MPNPAQEPRATEVQEPTEAAPAHPAFSGPGWRIARFLVCTVCLRNFLAVHAAVIGLLIGLGAITDRNSFERGMLIAGIVGACFGLFLWTTARIAGLTGKHFAFAAVHKMVGAVCLWFVLVVLIARMIQVLSVDLFIRPWEGSLAAGIGSLVAGGAVGIVVQEIILRRAANKPQPEKSDNQT